MIDPSRPPSEHELLRGARAGDGAALGVMLRRLRPRMHALALRVCRSPADADDAVQQACLAIVERLHQYRGDAPFATWVCRVTHNAALMSLRRRRALLSLDGDGDGDGVAAHLPDPAPAPDERCQHRRELLAVQRAAQRLSPGLLLALELREVLGMDGAAVARQLGVTREVVKTRVHRARAALRQAM